MAFILQSDIQLIKFLSCLFLWQRSPRSLDPNSSQAQFLLLLSIVDMIIKYVFYLTNSLYQVLQLFYMISQPYSLQQAYEKAMALTPLQFNSQYPLTFQDSLTSIPNYPFCTLGVLTAEARWGMQKGIAFVVEDNYLLTCASNCYSHYHGQYPNITFTINSNRKHRYDTYKIAKVLIPMQYKTLAQYEGDQFDYALLYIEGTPNLKDKYGSIHRYKGPQVKNGLFFYECTFDSRNELELVTKRLLSFQLNSLYTGMPIFVQNQSDDQQRAYGMIIQKGKNKVLQKFPSKIYSKFSKQTMIENGYFRIGYQIRDGYDCSNLKNRKPRALGQIHIANIVLPNKQRVCLLQNLPFSSLQSLVFEHNADQIPLNLSFLRMEKFRQLRQLRIHFCHLNAQGCRQITEANLRNLRALSICQEDIGQQGCRNLASADWPLLQSLKLYLCKITMDGLILFFWKRRLNIKHFELRQEHNDISGGKLSKLFRKNQDLVRLQTLQISGHMLVGRDFQFLRIRTGSWKMLKTINFMCNLGTKGCKMISQADIVPQHIQLQRCQIDELGMKWLCKTNLSKVVKLILLHNKIGVKGCYYLSKSNIRELSFVTLPQNRSISKGKKWLMLAK